MARAEAALFRNIRLEALRLCPAAFGASFEDEQRLSDAEFAVRIPESPPNAIFGAIADDDSEALLGILGFRVNAGTKERHKAWLWGMYVRPAVRGRGIGAALLRHAIEHARQAPRVEVVQLGVVMSETAARRLYGRAGFMPYGIERRALRLGPDDYRDEELQALILAKGQE